MRLPIRYDLDSIILSVVPDLDIAKPRLRPAHPMRQYTL